MWSVRSSKQTIFPCGGGGHQVGHVRSEGDPQSRLTSLINTTHFTDDERADQLKTLQTIILNLVQK